MDQKQQELEQQLNKQQMDQLEEIVQRAVKQAFREVGLHDDSAGKDVTELRSLLTSWRDFKGTVFKTLTTAGTFFVLGLLSLGAWTRINGGGE